MSTEEYQSEDFSSDTSWDPEQHFKDFDADPSSSTPSADTQGSYQVQFSSTQYDQLPPQCHYFLTAPNDSTEPYAEYQGCDPFTPGIPSFEGEFQPSTASYSTLTTQEHPFDHAQFDCQYWHQAQRYGLQGVPAFELCQEQALPAKPLSQSMRGPSAAGSSMSPWSSTLRISSTPSPSPLTTQAESQSPSDERSPADTNERYTCGQCENPQKTYKSRKSLDRHKLEAHRESHDRQPQRDSFTCVCGYQVFYTRKANYIRHLQVCEPTEWCHQGYYCQCLQMQTEKRLHELHVRRCREGRRPVGRPRRST